MGSTANGRVAYVNARLLDPASGLDAPGGLITEGETIAGFGPEIGADGPPDGCETVDCRGYCLAPGLVDVRVQLREPGEEHKGTLASTGRAATAGGITSLICLPNTTPVIDDNSVVEFVARRARLLGLTKVYPYAAVTKGLAGEELAELGMLAEAGAVAFTDGVKAVANAKVLAQALSYARTFGLLIVEHPEEPALAHGGDMNAGEMATRLGLVGIPAAAEVIMVERDVRLAELTQGRLHFAHLSTAAAIDVVRRAKARGLDITCETAPPYFALNENAIGEYRTFGKLSPPLRGGERPVGGHRGADRRNHRCDRVRPRAGGRGCETAAVRASGVRRHRPGDAVEHFARALSQPPPPAARRARADYLQARGSLRARRRATGARRSRRSDAVRSGSGLAGA